MSKSIKNGSDDHASLGTTLELSPDALYREGTQHLKAKDYPSARACLEKYIEIRPDDPTACQIFAKICYHQNKDLGKAEACLKHAIEMDRDNQTHYLESLGVIYIHQGKYILAEDLFLFAIEKDKKDDPRHTASLEYYLRVVRKKVLALDPSKKQSEPEFLITDSDRWTAERKQTAFFLPSLFLHVLALLLVSYLSTHELPFKKPEKEDFTYVQMEQGEAPPSSEEASQAGATGKESAEQSGPEAVSPAPLSEGKEVQTAGVGRTEMPGTGPANIKDNTAPEQRGQIGGKGTAALSAEGGEITMARALPGEKSMDIKAQAPGVETPDVDLMKRSLGGVSSGKSAGGAKEAEVASLAKRAGGAAASGADGIFMGDNSTGKKSGWDKEKRIKLNGAGPADEAAKVLGKGGEKRLAVDEINIKNIMAKNGLPDLSRPLGLGSARSGSEGARAGGGSAAVKSLNKGEAEATGRDAFKGLVTGPSGGEAALGGGKSRVSLGTPDGAASPGALETGDDRRVTLPGSSAAGRQYVAADAVPMKRSLNMPYSGSNTSKGPQQGKESFTAPDRAGSSASGPASGTTRLSNAGGPGAGGSASSGSGKGVNSKALVGGREDVSGIGGLIESAARKVTDAFSIGGGTRSGNTIGPAGSDLIKRKSLAGLAPGTGGGGKGYASGTGAGSAGEGGVKLGTGEKQPSRVTAPAKTLASGVYGGQVKEGVSGGKRTIEGALGVPGGTAAERYASAKTAPMPKGTEKQHSGIPRGRNVASNAAGPSVSIISPSSGDTASLTQTIIGKVSDVNIRKATLTVNNDSRVISVENGSFQSVVSLSRGRNTITVLAFDMTTGEHGQDSITLDYSEPTEGAPVAISSPKDGQTFDVSERSVINVRGTIGDQDIKRAKLILNGNPMDIVVNRGSFDQKVTLEQEQNTILVEAVTPGGQVSKSQLVTVNTVNVKPKDIMIILTWDKPHADFDLHVYGPGGGHTYAKQPNHYESKDAIFGAQLEQDARNNFGPEVFTQDRAEKGEYTVKSNYFYSGGDGDAHATVKVILYGDNPSRRQVHVFGPHLQTDTKTGEDFWEVTKFRMPDGIFLEE